MSGLNSISTRVGVYATAILLAVGLAAAYVVYTAHQRLLTQQELDRLQVISEQQSNATRATIARLREDTQFLAGTPPLDGLARARANGGIDPLNDDSIAVWESRLTTIFASFLRRHPDYQQVRLIGFEDGGKEMVRVERLGESLVMPTGADALQRKADSDYLKASSTLSREAVYLSDITLNREYGRVTRQRTPVLRAATPIYGLDGKPFAAVVVNLDVSGLFEDLVRGAPRGMGVYLTNQGGGYLLDSEREQAFGADLGRPRLIQDDLPVLSALYSLDSNTDRALFDIERRTENGVRNYALRMTKIRFDPAAPDRFLALGLFSSYDYLLGASREAGVQSALAAACMIVVGAVLLFLHVRMALSPLAVVAESTERVAAGDFHIDLPPVSDDEVGRLARSFRRMVAQIEQRNSALESRGRELEVQQRSLVESNAQLEEMQRDLQQQAGELERAAQYKSDFLARISHDLRTPLNSMLILANTLANDRDGNLNEHQRQSSRILSEAGRDLLALVDDILDLSKAEAGRIDVALSDTSPSEILTRVRDQFLPLAESKGVALDLSIADDVPDSFLSDPRRLRQILWNLVSNALKFTPSGRVDISARRDSEQRSIVLMEVADTGPGIPPEDLKDIFEPYRQLSSQHARTPGGTGLGLAIARELARALGGDLTATSDLGSGSRFTLSLAIAPTRTRQEPKDADPIPLELGRKRVLIVEDDEPTQWIIARSLEDQTSSVEIHRASDTAEALAALRFRCFSTVILDFHLRHSDSWAVLDAVAQQPEIHRARVLLYTGHSLSGEDRRRARRLGAAIIPKDGSIESVRRLAQQALADAREQTDPALRGVKLLLVDDDMAGLFALSSALAEYGAEVEQAFDGRDALDKLRNRRDIDAVLMDTRMPSMDGNEATRRIRQAEEHRALPIFAITGDATQEDQERAFDAGVTEFVSKPIDPADLVRKLSSYL